MDVGTGMNHMHPSLSPDTESNCTMISVKLHYGMNQRSKRMNGFGKMVKDLRIRKKLSLLIIIFMICLLAVSLISYFTINKVKIDGKIYQKISSGKDLIADILPPPEYVIDSYATVLDMAVTADPSRIETLAEALQAQKSLFEERHQYWEGNLSDGDIRQLLLDDAYQSGLRFYEIAENEVIPLIKAGNQAAAQQLIGQKLTPVFEQHRGYIDQIVAKASTDNTTYEKQSSNTVTYSILLLLGLMLLGIFATILLGSLISSSISNPINRLREYADRLAVGDTDYEVVSDSKDEVGDLMSSFSRIISNTKAQAQAGSRIARGDLTVAVEPRSDYDIIAFSMNSIVSSIQALTDETRMLTAAAANGDLSKRGNADAFEGGFREIVAGINHTLDGIVTPLNVALDFIEDVANGEDLKEINNIYEGQYKELISHLMMVRKSLLLLTSETTHLAEAFIQGRFSYQPDTSQLKGGYLEIMESVSKALNGVTDPLRLSGKYMRQIGNGEIPEKILEKYPGDFQQIVDSINNCVDGLSALIEGRDVLQRMSVNDYTKRMEGSYQGVYAEISDSINGVSTRVINILRVVRNIAFGDLDDLPELKRLGKRSENDELMPTMIQLMETINSAIFEAAVLSISVIDGNLEYRSDTRAFRGAWEELVNGMNQIMIEVAKPLKDVSEVMEDISEGMLNTSVKGHYKGSFERLAQAVNTTAATLNDLVRELTAVIESISEGNLNLTPVRQYHGDFVSISDALNVIIDSLNAVMKDINDAAEQVSSGSKQVSDGSQTLSHGSAEQSSAIEELNNSMGDISQQTRQNAVNADQANELASIARSHAVNGNQQMKDMLHSMDEINDSSANISKIIKVIDDIAFQTNILSLNAAVEAARAGEHGKGFAVVAEEVRNLAARSSEAAKNTTELIEGSIQKVQMGTKFANETASALEKIVDDIEKAANLVSEIAAASNDQATGISQINQGIEQVSKVVQSNSATAEESAAASEELSGQADLLKGMVGRFQLRGDQQKLLSGEFHPC